jgi:hypothetical protein
MEKHSYLAIQRWRHMDRILRERIDQHGEDTCIVIGSDATEVVLLDDYLAVYFNDAVAGNGIKSDYTTLGTPRCVESFYWSPDMPEIVQQQAHEILHVLRADPTARQCFVQLQMQPNRTFNTVFKPGRELLRKFTKKIIYPKFPQDWFQVDKQMRTHENPQWETWFNSNPHAQEFLAPWQSAIRHHTNLISDQYKNYHEGYLAGYTKFMSPFYAVGRLLE